MKLLRRSLVGLALLAALITIPAWWSMPNPKSRRIETAVIPPPTHIAWEAFPVGGLTLCHPKADSLGQIRCLVLPPGSILSVPRTVQGVAPDDRRDKS